MAWAAGFFDGEGCSSVRYDYKGKIKGNPAPIITISQCDPRPLKRFKQAVAPERGSVVLVKRPPKESHHKNIWKFTIVGISAKTAIDKMWPFLSEPKKEQWRRVIERVNTEHKPSHKGRKRGYDLILDDYR